MLANRNQGWKSKVALRTVPKVDRDARGAGDQRARNSRGAWCGAPRGSSAGSFFRSAIHGVNPVATCLRPVGAEKRHKISRRKTGVTAGLRASPLTAHWSPITGHWSPSTIGHPTSAVPFPCIPWFLLRWREACNREQETAGLRAGHRSPSAAFAPMNWLAKLQANGRISRVGNPMLIRRPNDGSFPP